MKALCNNLLILIALLALTGCSISYSLEKSSDSISESLDSISASFDSFSSSSGGGEEEVTALLDRFQNDVSGLTRIWVREDRAPGDFETSVSQLALQYGIVDWEGSPEAFHAIGSGLRQAGVDTADISRQPILQSNLMKMNETFIVAGYLSS
jgi:hypothetical protein